MKTRASLFLITGLMLPLTALGQYQYRSGLGQGYQGQGYQPSQGFHRYQEEHRRGGRMHNRVKFHNQTNDSLSVYVTYTSGTSSDPITVPANGHQSITIQQGQTVQSFNATDTTNNITGTLAAQPGEAPKIDITESGNTLSLNYANGNGKRYHHRRNQGQQAGWQRRNY